MTIQNITKDAMYDAVAPDDFESMLELDRYGNRSTAFDKIISATHDHFWDPLDPKYIDFSEPFDMENEPLLPESQVFALTAGLTQTIFDGGAIRGQVEYSRARYAELLSDYHKTVLTALGNVEDALVAVQQTSEQELRQQVAADVARRAFEFAQYQMKAGTINVLTVLNTENALFTAQDSLVQVKYQHLQALVDLYQALGGGWRLSQADQ